MLRATLYLRLICLSVIATICCGIIQPARADDQDNLVGPEYRDPTIVTDDSTSTPDGVKDLAKKFHQVQPIQDPVYNKWWFWATAIGVAGVVSALAIIPFHKNAPGCASGQYALGCVGDGR